VLKPEAFLNPMPPELPTSPAEAAPQLRSANSARPSTADEPRSPQEPTKPPASRIRVERADDLASVKLRRSRDKDHLGFIAHQPCTVCGRQPCEAHHLRFSQPRALGRKVSDEFTVPLCRVHHRELHRQGDERAWWNKANIDPMPIALRFWQDTRGLPLTASRNQKAQGPDPSGSIEDRGGAGVDSLQNSSSLIADIADSGTAR